PGPADHHRVHLPRRPSAAVPIAGAQDPDRVAEQEPQGGGQQRAEFRGRVGARAGVPARPEGLGSGHRSRPHRVHWT
ncbi:hypothetical protein, partial [Priestia megaterium]|uniref:hypothetical protein n=1 Tax=Priestia megaterium TaxID=1404 RepID=UPI0035B60BB4